MSGGNKRLMRIALAMKTQLIADSHASVAMPSDQVQRCERLMRQFNVARQRHWFAAASRIRDRLRVALGELRTSLQTVDRAVIDHREAPSVSNLRHIYDDLVSLYDEFTDVRIDFKTRQISVTTEPIELEDVYLGRFEIQLTWNDLRNGHPQNYRVVALDPVPAAANDSVTHPHVQDESLCEGDGHLPILSALRQGRLYDFFVIVANLLRTYNSGSPYVALSDWHGVECSACGCTSTEDDIRSCEKCETSLCTDCCEFCEDCSGTFCNECTSCCECCSEYRCDRCLQPCSNCDAATCRGCLEDKERCSDCHEKEEKEAKANEGQPISPCLRFTPSAWAKLLFLRDYGDTEVGGFGIAPIDDLLLVEDVQLVHQRTSWAHVEFEDESVADHFDRHVEAGRQPEQFARIWIHTHPGDWPEPSLTDEETFSRVFGRSEWAMMFILARGGDAYARLRFNVGPGGEVLLPATVDFSTAFSASETDQWQREYAANVFAKTTARPVRTAETISNHSDPEDPFEDFELSDGWQEYMEQELAFAGELL